MIRAPRAVNNFEGITIQGTARVHLGNRIVYEDEVESKVKGALAAAEWLSSSNHYQRRKEIFSKRHGRTGEWFLHTPDFHKWVNDEDQTLWCYGIAGSGKSVIASLIADRLIQYKQDHATYVAFLFADPDIGHRTTAEDIISSILKQFLIEHEFSTCCSHLENLYTAHHRRKSRPSWEECLEVFRLFMERLSKVYIVIDGLDQQGILDESVTMLLSALESWTNLNLLITTRSKTPFTDWKRPRAYINISASKQDMKSYIEHRTIMVPGLQNILVGDTSVQDAFVDTIINQSQGMFLMAKLHLDSIATKHCLRHVQAALHTYPTSINDMYRVSWLRMHKQNPGTIYLATKVLDMVCYTYEPLTASGLQYALSPPWINKQSQDEIVDENLLISICCGLIFIAPDETVRFIHPTAHQFYKDLRIYSPRALLLRLTLTLLWTFNHLVTESKVHLLIHDLLWGSLNKTMVSALGLLSKTIESRKQSWMGPCPTSLKSAISLFICIVVILYLML
ncbi:hypothetical protein P170DRAFT_438328 [Aspergillus steynii IBT 23096]|uniref:Uncharacterized protein n=1 Tax=Aspergillus steynii IBT 23096 TaxID=1392250 RepID=A0A2I2G160_9EURO|nr:uncharacterized protein P170DRAFT_438328 [Aspergillus steynii IBT 23096]PLB46615.1 hypothetical protein P170DRAFT_438328 [Aspergillus steynii IBT 23096]